jgi:hypothetical protein
MASLSKIRGWIMKQLPFDKWRSRKCEPSRVIPSIKRKIRFEERGEGKIMLNLMVLLYNF